MIQLKTISKKAGFVLAIAGAAVVGGASTALVSASIPGSDGTISACYNQKGGALNVIDAEAGKTCTNKQNPISWSSGNNSGSGGVAVHDANGQLLGNLVEYNPLTVYEPSLNRVVRLDVNVNDSTKLIVNPNETVFFQSTDCSGQAYIAAGTFSKTEIVRWQSGGSDVYGKVSDNASASSVATQSYMTMTDVDSNVFACSSGGTTGSMYPVTTVTLPFSTPAQGVQGPIQF